MIWCIKWQLLFLSSWSRYCDENGSECECMCINIGISPNLIHITWPTWMRSVPCRVACYYKFNVKSGSKKMREGGCRIWNGSIHLPFFVGQQMCSKEKSKATKADVGRGEIILYRTTLWSLFHPFGWCNWLSKAAVYCIHQWRYSRAISCVCVFTFTLPHLLLRGKISTESCTDAVFFLYHLERKHMCDHGQGFPLLVSSSIVAMSLCQWRERLLNEAIVWVCVVNGDGPWQGLGGQQAAFTRLLLCPGLLQQDGLFRKDTPVSCAPLCCPCLAEHWAQVRPWRKGLIRSGE